jgi:Protein of unknown function (DUF1566)
MKKLGLRVAAAALLVTATAAQAALVNRGGGMIYDSTRDITWLADMNYARTSGHTGAGVDATGRMDWDAANNWANNLVFGGFSDWRLPTVTQPDTTCEFSLDPGSGFGLQHYGSHCTGSEMGHLVYIELGGRAGESVLNQTGDAAQQIANLALFSNVQSLVYWATTEYAPDSSQAWIFVTDDGYQFSSFKSSSWFAVAVRPGDVHAVPEPQTLALALLAMSAAVAAQKAARLRHCGIGHSSAWAKVSHSWPCSETPACHAAESPGGAR